MACNAAESTCKNNNKNTTWNPRKKTNLFDYDKSQCRKKRQSRGPSEKRGRGEKAKLIEGLGSIESQVRKSEGGEVNTRVAQRGRRNEEEPSHGA
jgi:hypothetical protein